MTDAKPGRGADWALFLDFDGTLVDIAERPEAVRVEAGLPETLDRLWTMLGGALALVTGRTIADVSRYIDRPALDICGMHGLERRVGGTTTRPEGLAEIGDEIRTLERRFADRPGILVEDKRIGVALHWRLAPDAEADALDAMAALADRLGPAYRLQDGKAVREIVPAASGKGGALRALMEHPPYRGRRPFFVGDDRTDEHGFEAANALGGLSLKLGDGATVASKRLETAAAFRLWLSRWATGGDGPDTLPPAR